MKLPGKTSIWFESFIKHEFEVGDRPVTIVCPQQPLDNLRWVWKGEFLDAFPGTELALLRKGFYIVETGYGCVRFCIGSRGYGIR